MNIDLNKSNKTKETEKELIKTQSEIEKELDIRSYSEYRIKDDNSSKDYVDEDVEAKMIRLVILKKKGGNVLDNINLVRKRIKPKDFPKINKALSIIEKIVIRKKIKKFFNKLKNQRTQFQLKKSAADFLQKLKKSIWKIYLKKYFFYFNKSLVDNTELVLSKVKSKKKNNSILIPAHASKKKLKKYNKQNIKFELITKKNSLQKKNGIDSILEKIEREKEEEKIRQSNFSNLKTVNEKLKKSQKKDNNFFQRTKIINKKKKSHIDIKVFKTKLSEKEKSLKNIKTNSMSDKDSSFFSGQSPSEITSINNKENGNQDKNYLSEVLSSNDNGSNNFIKEVIKLKDVNDNKIINDDDLYSIYSKEESKESKKSKESKGTSNSKKENDVAQKRNSIRSMQSKKVKRSESKQNMRISAKLSGLKFKKKESDPSSIYDLIDRKTTFDKRSKVPAFIKLGLEKNENQNKKEESEEEEDEEENMEQEEEETDEEEEEEEDDELSFNYDTNEDSERIIRTENKKKINLVEYDLFYKEQFLRNDVFEYDADNIKDEENEKINKEINKLEIERKLLEKRKLKEVMELKGENTKELQEEINELIVKKNQFKKVDKENIVLNLDTTEEFYKKGRQLNIYFNNKKDKNFPHFSLENSEEIGAREIIDFKPLRKEELIRRYFDDHCCLEQRKKINKILVYSRYVCRYFVDNLVFEYLSSLLIIINSILIFVSDPTNPNNIGNKTDNYFLIFYTFEAILKIITFTFFSAEDAYIKDYWNILDLLVVIIGLISFGVEKMLGGKKISGLSALKAFRILRPLKTVKRFKGLKNVVLALLASIGHLGETVIVIFFFFLLFSITGLQMWQGLFYRRCMNVNYGYLLSTTNDKYMCSFDSNCKDLNTYGMTFICAKGYLNPNSGAINFDNISSSLITVFITVTLEGWSYIYTYVSKTFKDKIYINPIIIFVYFHLFLYIGAFYLINLFLAVTNSEFENIDKNRKKIKEKKSFYKLIKSKYDLNEKKKIEKKENEKLLKIKNNKKSDEALKELYYKVKDDAFHISKNKRDIPKLYSTIKDIYIMANNNPEELFLEKKRIKMEEESLNLDIERQRKEIKLLIKEKREEMDKSKINSKKNVKQKNNKKIEKKEDSKIIETNLTERYRTSGIHFLSTNNGNNNASVDEMKNSQLKLSKLKKEDLNIDVSEIIKLKDNINSNLIEISIENTLKSYFEKIKILKSKMSMKTEEINNVKKENEKNNEKEDSNQISFFEDTKFEKIQKAIKEKEEKDEKVEEEDKTINRFGFKRKKTKLNTLSGQSFTFLNRNMKERSSKKIDYLFLNRGALEDNNQNIDEALINKEISFIDDLSLSSLNGSSESDKNVRRLRFKRGGTNININPNKNMLLTKLNMDDYKNNLDKLSYDNDLYNNNILGLDKFRKSVNLKDTEIRCMNNLMDSFIDSKNIINTKTIIEWNIKSKFEKPHSSLNFITKDEEDQKFNDENIRFNLKKYLKKEAEKDNEFLNKDRRKSFLGFLEYAQYQKELKLLDDLIDGDIYETDRKNANSVDNDLQFLSEDSYLSRNDNISVEDNDLLPTYITQKEIYQNEYLIHENIEKNLNTNKLTKLIRAEIFDRESINTNINLKTNELKMFYEKVNKKLDEQLYVNKRKIRLREEKNMNISGIINDKNYNKYLKILEEEEEQEKEENINRKVKDLRKNESKKNLKFLEEDMDNSKKIEEKIEEKKIIQSSNGENINSNCNKSARNSDFPLINKQKTLKLLNGRISNNNFSPFNISNKNILAYSNQNKNVLRNSFHKPSFRSLKSIKKDNQSKISSNPTINNKKNNFIFKAKSIEKNINKYPVENSNKYVVKEENKESTDPLTVEQERILSYLRGKKYYMNYLYNIQDKDLKVKDNFIINHWEDDVLGTKQEKIFRSQILPKRLEAYFVFNDKKLKLKKYQYMNCDNKNVLNNDNEEEDEKDISTLTIQLKYLPFNVLALMPKRLRNFGNFITRKENNNIGPLGFKPDTNFLSTIDTNNQQISYNKSKSGRTTSTKLRSKGSLMMSSAFTDNIMQDEIRYKKNIFEKVSKKIEEFNYLTLSHYFLNEDKLFNKFMDKSKKEEIVQIINESNRKKYNRINVRNEAEEILLFDLKTNSSKYIRWSGSEVLCHSNIDDNKTKWNNIIYSLENFNIIIWHQNKTIKYMQKVRYAFYVFANNELFELIVLVIVMINSIVMALEGNFLKPEILNKVNIGNYIFNSIFILEYVVKFIGLTPLVYFSDAFTYLDTLIIIFAIVDMVTPSNNDTDIVGSKKSVTSQLSFLRVFRIFRIVRLAKILRKLKSMRSIIVSIKRALRDVKYILLILIMFILIFELLGLSLLNGNKHFQTFLEGFYTTYQILTMENWDGIFIEIWPLNHLCIFYFVLWIFLGNYILFNLFISILLQSFRESEEKELEDLMDDEEIEKKYYLPDYLYIIKNNIKDKNLWKIHAKRKKKKDNKELLIKKPDNNNAYATADLLNPMSVSTNLEYSKISISGDESENEDKDSINAYSTIIEGNDEEDDFNNSRINLDGKRRKWKKINKIFKNNNCENSLFLIPQKNGFRIFCMKLITNKWFDNFILSIIILSTIRLIVDTFISGYTFVLLFDISDSIFNIIFLIEAIIKIIAMGFVFDEGTYLRDNWNKIDVLIVICSFIEFHSFIQKYILKNNITSSVDFLKVLRLLRTLRPLRIISHDFHLKLIIASLFDSISSIFHTLFILVVVLFMFSVVGISLFYSYFHNCYTLKNHGFWNLAIDSFDNILADYEIKNDITSISRFCADKYNGIMDAGPAFKFSNLKSSLITSYILSTMEGWPDIMNSYRIYNDYYGIYFIAFNIVVAYFFLNLFIGIMFKYFNEAFKREQKIAKDDKKAPKYYDFLNQILDARSDYIIWNKPMKGTIKYYLREFVDNDIFQYTMMVIILLNMILMAISFDGSSANLSNLLKTLNYFFTIIFIIECLLKIFAYGIKPYFHITWNKFDFFVIQVSLIDWIVNNVDGIDASFLKTFQIIRVLKVLTVSRVLRLVKALKGLEKLIQTLQWSISALVNVLSLTIIIYCIFALVGYYLYDGNKYANFKDKFVYINEYFNMDNFFNAYLLIFRCSTGENWHNIMIEMAFRDDGRGEGYSIIFFIVGNFITAIILLNLLLMVTLQQYDEFTDKKYNPIERFNSFLTDFNNGWNKFSTDEDEGFRIKKTLVTEFFSELNWRKLNFPEKGKIEYIKKYVSDLKLYFDSDDCVYYHDVIYKLINKQMGSQIERNNKDNYLIFKKEKELQKKIKKLINDYIIKKNGKKANQILSIFNPLTAHLYYKFSFQYMKVFINFYKENAEFLQHLGESNIQSNLFNSSNDIFENSEESDENNSNSSNSNSNSKSNESKSDNEKDNDNDSNKNSSLNKEENSFSKNENNDNKIKSNSNSSNNFIKFVNNSSSSFQDSSEDVKENSTNNNEKQESEQNQKNENENEDKKE